MAKIKGIKTKVGDSTSAATKVTVDSSGGGAPVASGIVTMLAKGSVPSGWLLCDGAEYDQSTYSGLYSVIGSAYNIHPTLGAASAGKFRVPDFRDMFPLGMNPSGDTGTTSLGTYSTTGWNHTHTVPAHTHTLGNHTHTLGAHTHTVPLHSHTIAHDHGIPSHTHGIAQHIHYFAGHRHSHSINVTSSHYHQIGVTSDTNTGTGANRVSSGGTNWNLGLASAGGFTLGIGGTVGSTNNADGGFNTDWVSVNDATPTTSATGTTGGVSTASSGNAAAFTSGAPSSDATGAPSSNTTSTDGAAPTDGANPPYFGVHFIIKT